MNLSCIIDACSYIYLHQSKFNIGGTEHTLFSFLSQFITLKHSNIVNSEISKNFSGGEGALERSRRNYKFKKKNFKLAAYDNKLFNNTILAEPPLKDRGEKANLAVGIDMVINSNSNGIIYLTDDRKAISRESSLWSIFEAFPYFPTWTSFDVILFLYLFGVKKGYTLEIAKDSIKDLNYILFQPGRKKIQEDYENGIIDRLERDRKMQSLNKKAQEQEASYIRRLQIVKKIIA